MREENARQARFDGRMSEALGRRAVVVGAGIAGLAAARAVADAFEEVLVLERDELDDTAAHRPGVPQSRHAHGLLGGGQRALDELFPGFDRDLDRAGALRYRPGLESMVERPGYDPFPRRDVGLTSYTMSRPLLEQVVRRRLDEQANVTVHGGCRVLRLLDGGGAVTGVELGCPEGRTESVPAELVIDASGRGFLTVKLLEAIGRPPPVETRIGVDFGYSTAVFAIPPDASTNWKMCMHLPDAPRSSRMGLVMPIEGDRWMVSLGGRHDDKPPGDPEGFLAFAASLRTPTIHRAIAGAQRLGEIARFGFPASVWRRLDLPPGLLPIGDAICRFNPVYGQGMSVALQEASLLRRLLAGARRLEGLGAAFLDGAQPLIETPWSMAALPDLVYPHTEGERPADFAERRRFGAALVQLAAEDPALHRLTLEVQHLLTPPTAYRDPVLLRRVQALMNGA